MPNFRVSIRHSDGNSEQKITDEDYCVAIALSFDVNLLAMTEYNNVNEAVIKIYDLATNTINWTVPSSVTVKYLAFSFDERFIESRSVETAQIEVRHTNDGLLNFTLNETQNKWDIYIGIQQLWRFNGLSIFSRW